MLHFERKRLKAIGEAEAKGEDVWTSKFNQPVRVKIAYALQHAACRDQSTVATALEAAQIMLGGERGKYRLTDKAGITPAEDFFTYLHTCPDDMMPSVIEAAIYGLRLAAQTSFVPISVVGFKDDVRIVLDRHRISWVLAEDEDEMYELKSKSLHSGVVEPTLRLLAGRKDLATVQDAYQEALRKVSQGEPENAITDAGTALQEMLTACGCKGNQLGDLATDARKKGLVAPHDVKLVDWIAADRSQKGDSHRVVRTSKDDAWLNIYVVGALVVRLAAGKR